MDLAMNDSAKMNSSSSPMVYLVVNGVKQNLSILADWKSQLETVKTNTDSFFLVGMGVLIFRISAICYWLLGWGLAFGKTAAGVIGTSEFGLANLPDSSHTYPHWFFQFTFAATAATIVSGALAERCEFIAYFAYCASLTGFVYPVITHWCWSPNGWLLELGYMDFAGSGVVHLQGGTCALVGAIILGPRIGRFRSHEKPKEFLTGHSVPFAALGGFILMFGFFAFNGGSQASVSKPGDGEAIARAMMNTMLNGGFSAMTVLMLNKFFGSHKWSILLSINAVLTGMVSSCAGCNVYEPWAAIFCGTGAAVTYLTVSNLVRKLRIDDPVDAVAVHMGGGFWGLMIAPVLGRGGIVWDIQNPNTWKILGVNVLAAVCIVGWSGFWLGFVFLILHFTKKFRVSAEVETNGLDIFKHGEPSYPLAAYGHGWLEYETDVLCDKKFIAKHQLNGFAKSAPNVMMERYETPELGKMKGYKVRPKAVGGSSNNGETTSTDDDSSGGAGDVGFR